MQSPIAKLLIRNGAISIDSDLYAPGLPDGEHEVYMLADHIKANAGLADAIIERDKRIAQLESDDAAWRNAAVVWQAREKAKDARIAELEKALRYFADPERWQGFEVTCGSIMNALEGDTALAFDADEEDPWNVARLALEAPANG